MCQRDNCGHRWTTYEIEAEAYQQALEMHALLSDVGRVSLEEIKEAATRLQALIVKYLI